VPPRTILALVPMLAGCWQLDRAPAAPGPHPWAPIAEAPAGWELVQLDADASCPDGEAAPLLLVRPRGDSAPRAVALVLHHGAFDYPTTGPVGDDAALATYLRDPPRLDRAWAIRQAASALGSWAPPDAATPSTGALPAALAARGVASLVAGNCWGDLGAGRGQTASADGFARRGAELHRAAWTMITAPTAADVERLGFEPTEGVVVALGDSGRGAGALLRTPGMPAPSAVLFDSVPDDLAVYYDAPASWSDIVVGLDRIWPAGRAAAAADAAATAPWPARVVVLWSSEDPVVPRAATAALADASAARGATVRDTALVRHLQAAADPEVASWAVDALLGAPPDAPDDTDG
jgi:hypothetical protein